MFAACALQGTHGSVIPAIRANLKKRGLDRGTAYPRVLRTFAETTITNSAHKKRPSFPGRFRNYRMQMSAETEPRLRGGFRGRAVDDLRSGCARDRNAAGLLGLGNLANEIDVK